MGSNHYRNISNFYSVLAKMGGKTSAYSVNLWHSQGQAMICWYGLPPPFVFLGCMCLQLVLILRGPPERVSQLVALALHHEHGSFVVPWPKLWYICFFKHRFGISIKFKSLTILNTLNVIQSSSLNSKDPGLEGHHAIPGHLGQNHSKFNVIHGHHAMHWYPAWI